MHGHGYCRPSVAIIALSSPHYIARQQLTMQSLQLRVCAPFAASPATKRLDRRHNVVLAAATERNGRDKVESRRCEGGRNATGVHAVALSLSGLEKLSQQGLDGMSDVTTSPWRPSPSPSPPSRPPHRLQRGPAALSQPGSPWRAAQHRRRPTAKQPRSAGKAQLHLRTSRCAALTC